jgi:DNA replication and repair protein RecF
MKQMILKSLHLRNFRNYKNESITFSPGINILYGSNAVGKTNLLEAIYLLSTGKSFRTNNMKEIIMEGEKYFSIIAEIEKEGITQIIKVYYDIKTKKAQYNASTYSSFTNLLGILLTTIHTASDIELITHSPILRRRFLNIHLAQKDPLYVHHLSRYSRAIKNRNSLLRHKNNTTIKAWEKIMAKSAIYLTNKRKEALAQLVSYINSYHHKLTNKNEEIDVRYLPSIEEQDASEDKYLLTLKNNREKEFLYKFTLVGPHRDDFAIYLDNKNAKNFASEGQKMTSTYALKLAEWEMLSSNFNEKALMLFDDIGAFLDNVRKKLLIELISNNMPQAFVTTPSKKNLQFLPSTSAIFSVDNGTISSTIS